MPVEQLREQYSETPKQCLERKWNNIKDALEKYPEVAEAEEREMVTEKINTMLAEIDKVKPEQVAPASHYAHLIGTMESKFGFADRLRKLSAKEAKNEKAITECKMQLEEALGSIGDYIDLCLNNKFYFYSELFSREGYFADKTLENSDKKIQELNAHEFIMISKETLGENIEDN